MWYSAEILDSFKQHGKMHQDLCKIHSTSAENYAHTAIPTYIQPLFQTLNIFHMQSSTLEIMETHK